jgi:predicted flap endonuclease-1-like 5' DNA nuclease
MPEVAMSERNVMASIAAIVSIGARDAAKLRRSGVRTTEALLRRGATRRGRTELAVEAKCTEAQILEWVNRADLMRVRGVGQEYADLLEESGVDTVKELGRREPAILAGKMVQVNAKKKLVRRLPTEAMVERWVEHAGQLDGRVTY